MLSDLRDKVRLRMGAKRFDHTLGVEETVKILGEVFLPDKTSELRAAALLHDITKEVPSDIQRSLLSNVNDLTDEDLRVAEAYHSFTAPIIIENDFSDYATEQILSAVKNHTLASPDMDLFSLIVFIADYIEPNREYEHCQFVRDYLLTRISLNYLYKHNYEALIVACVMVIDFTADFLAKRNKTIHSKTLMTKNYLLSLI